MEEPVLALFIEFEDTLVNHGKDDLRSRNDIWKMKLDFKALDSIRNLAPINVFILSNEACYQHQGNLPDKFERQMEYVKACVCDYCHMDENHVDYTFGWSNSPVDNQKVLNLLFYKHFGSIRGNCLLVGNFLPYENCKNHKSNKQTANFYNMKYMRLDDFVDKYYLNNKIIEKDQQTAYSNSFLRDSKNDVECKSEKATAVVVKNEKYYKVYRYFKGEKENPFTDEILASFWAYEARFDQIWDKRTSKEWYDYFYHLGEEEYFRENVGNPESLPNILKHKGGLFHLWLKCLFNNKLGKEAKTTYYNAKI